MRAPFNKPQKLAAMYDEITIGDPYFVQTIELLKYLDNLRGAKSKGLPFDKLPELKCSSGRLANPNKYTKESIDDVCRKTMLLILTHAGYSKVDPECFELLSDLLKSYMKNLTSLFRRKLDQEAIVNSNASNVSSSRQSGVAGVSGLSIGRLNDKPTCPPARPAGGYQSNSEPNQDPLLLLGKVFQELGLSFATCQRFNFEQVLYRDHVLGQIEELQSELSAMRK